MHKRLAYIVLIWLSTSGCDQAYTENVCKESPSGLKTCVYFKKYARGLNYQIKALSNSEWGTPEYDSKTDLIFSDYSTILYRLKGDTLHLYVTLFPTNLSTVQMRLPLKVHKLEAQAFRDIRSKMQAFGLQEF